MNITRPVRRPAVTGMALIAAAGLVAGSTALTEAASAATAPGTARGTTSHTLHLTTKQLQDVTSGHSDVAAGQDQQRGKTTGYDASSCQINVNTHVAKCSVAVARRNGLLIGQLHVNLDTGQGTGKVMGGTRGLHGATGTITLAPGPSNTNKVTIHYQV